jgi:di/tricarboxylate transporter
VLVTAVIRENFRRYVPQPHWALDAEDVLVLQGDPPMLEKLVAQAGLELVGSKDVDAEALRTADVVSVEAVITAGSPMSGSTLVDLRLRERYGASVLAVSRRGRPIGVRVRRHKFREGDLVVIQGDAETMPDTLAALGCLPLAERRLALGRPRNTVMPVLILAVAVLLASTETVPVAIAFLGAAVAIAVLRILTLREIYASIEWPILVLLGALIPVGEAVHDTGGTELIAGWLSHAAALLPAYAVLSVVMAITMAATPVLHHAAAVIVMGPIAASLAQKLGLNPDPFLMAVAVGAGSDFLTPIGHQCNTLVMGPGGYRFTDYWHLGLPLSATVILLGVPLITFFWPIH